MSYKYDHLVFIGRLQPPTKAHLHIISRALDLSKSVIVVLGSCNSARTLRNPFTFGEREQMVRSCFPTEVQPRLVFVAQDDHTYQDEKWLTSLRSNVRKAVLAGIAGNSEGVTLHGINDARVGLIGHSKDETSYYLNMFPGWDSENVPAVKGIDATAVRDALFDGGIGSVSPSMVSTPVMHWLRDWTSSGPYMSLCEERVFVRKYQQQWANSPYPPTFVTVDAVVVQSGHVLLVRRGAMPGKGMWALPGGFLNPRETLEQGMLRELREETRLKIPAPVLQGSIQAREIFDDPHRSSRGRTITTAFLVHLRANRELPRVKGSDDADHAQWVPVADLDPRQFFEDHHHIIQVMLGRLRNG